MPRTSRHSPNFLITSPSSMNKTIELFKKQEESANVAPFVGNYSVPKQPYTLPDGTHIAAKSLKSTFTKFKETFQ